MSYITQTSLHSDIAPEFLVQALDDDRDGVADAGVWDTLLTAVESEINGILDQAGVTLPLAAPYPDAVVAATRYGALEKLWLRRGIAGDDRNPFAVRAREARKKLAEWAKEDKASANTVAAGSETQISL